MENENVDAQVDVEQEEQTSEEVVEETQEPTQVESDEVSVSKEKFKAMQRKAMAYDAMKRTTQSPQKEINNDPPLSEELKLIARGLSDEVIEKAKIIAKGNGISLQDALKDEMLIAFQAQVAERKKKEDAKLGASKGSGESQEESGIKPDMTRDEHMKVFKKVMGN